MAEDLNRKATVTLEVNGSNAERTLDRLRKSAKNLAEGIAAAAKAGDQASLNRLNKEYAAVNKEIRKIQSSASATQEVLRNLDKATPKELRKTVSELKRGLDKIPRGSKVWNEQIEKIKRVQAELDKVNATMRTGLSTWQRFNNWLNNTQTALVAGAAAMAGVTMAARKSVEDFAAMDQEMANVAKYTGMARSEVNSLNDEFRTMDTRSSRIQLNQLAQEAGRLGKNTEKDVMGFVRAADQINVALDELGDGATQELSKLTGIFGDEKLLGTEKSLLAVGSVINDLSQNSTAAAGYLVEFGGRMAGVGAQAGMTIPQIMGYAATLDSLAQNVEMSATAVSQLIMKMFTEPAKIAKAVGMDVKEFTDTLNRDTNEGLLMLLENLSKKGGMQALAPIFKEMGADGARASQVIAALAGNIETLRNQQEVAIESYRNATSVTREFEIQNSTAAAGLEKAKNKFGEVSVELGERLMPVTRYSITSLSALVKVLSILVKFIGENITSITLAATAIAAYTIVVKSATIAEKAHAAAVAVNTAAQIANKAATSLMAGATALLTGNISRATAAFRVFTTVIKANPIGLVVSLVTSLVAGMIALSTKTNEVRDNISNLTGEMGKMDEQGLREIETLDQLFGRLKGAAKGTETYRDAKKQLIDQYGAYLGGLISEKGEILNLEDAYNRLTDAVTRASKVRQIEKIKSQLEDAKMANISETMEIFVDQLIKQGYTRRQAYSMATEVQLNITTGQKMTPDTVAALVGSNDKTSARRRSAWSGSRVIASASSRTERSRSS